MPKAEGKITQEEHNELYEWFVDGRLSREEIRIMQEEL